MQPKNKIKKKKYTASKSNSKKSEMSKTVSKKELAGLKAAYKRGKLRFDSEKIAKAVLENFKKELGKH